MAAAPRRRHDTAKFAPLFGDLKKSLAILLGEGAFEQDRDLLPPAACKEVIFYLILQPTNEGIIQNETSENCLYLSVYTPNTRRSEGPLLPVLVWIHGGSFVYGCGMFPISGPEIFMRVC